MDKQTYVHRRKKRYMAQTLEFFEEHVEPHIPPEAADRAEEFKGIVRRKLHALALDACEIISLKPGEELNGAVVELRDRLHPDGQPISRRANA